MVSAVRSVFASSGPGPSGRIERLRQKLCAVEATTGLAGEHAAPLALGIPLIDRALGGGLSCGALHEIAAVRETETAAATGFALALAARGSTRSNSAAGRSVLWIAEDLSLAENGAPYGPGLAEAGNAPERLVTVAAAHSRDVLWAMEEALRCRAVGVVIGELRTRVIDPVATRRLSLAAAAGGTLGLILRTAPDDEPSAAATRWVIAALASEASGQRSHSISARAGHSPEAGSSARAAAPSSPLAGNGDVHGIGPPRLAVRLARNRRGHLGAWIVEWNSVEQRLELATHPEPVAAAAFDRPLRWRAKRAASAATL
jgi:protein ImuA